MPLRRRPKADKVEKAELTAQAEDEAVTKEVAVRAGRPAVVPKQTIPAPRAKIVPPPLAPLGRRERSHLARGRKEIEGRLDLHGMTKARAHRALLGFLSRASGGGEFFGQGAATVCFVTTAGRPARTAISFATASSSICAVSSAFSALSA